MEAKPVRPRRTGIAIALFAGALILGASGVVSLAVAALLGALGGKLAPHKFRTGGGHGASHKQYGPALLDDDTPPPAHARFSWGRLAATTSVFVLIWLATLLALGGQPTLAAMGGFFTKTAFLTIGGAYAVLPYVYQGGVEHYGWLTGPQMMDGLALGETTPGPLIMVVTWVFRNYVRDANRRIRVSIARINSFLQEHISGISVIQLFNRERKAREQFEERNRDYLEAYKDAIKAFALFYPTVEFLAYVAIALVFWFGGGQVLTGVVQVGVLVAFMQYAQRFFRPIQDLSEKFNTLQTAMASSERIFRLLDEPAPSLAPATPHRLAGIRGEIEFRNVWFSYRNAAHPTDEDWVLRDVSFRINPGEMIAVVGHTGAGKTTTIQLLLRFYEIQRGQILLDGIDIREFDPLDLRRHFGVVLQDPFLFTGTIESNVRLGTEGIDAARVEEALREVGLGQWIDSLPDGIRTQVSERGSTFSVGQRQLISFARALAHRPQILILDEATSSVDTRTEILIQRAMDNLMKNRTSFVIAHRLSTIRDADLILVMKDGDIVEQGNHEELLARKGFYFELHNSQFEKVEDVVA